MRTITALYDTRLDAETARAELTEAGIEASAIEITGVEPDPQAATDGQSSGGSGEHRGFFASLKDLFMPDADRHAYSEGMRRGGCLLTARVDEEDADDVCRILDDSEAIDFDSRQQQWASEGWQPDSWREPRSLTGVEDAATIPVVDEALRIGKRELERGGARVRSYVQDTPVQERASFRSDDDSSIAMDGEHGSRIGETEDERRERMQRERERGERSPL